MKPLPHLNDFLNTPDFWMLLLCDEFMGEDRFREFLESMKNEETSDILRLKKQSKRWKNKIQKSIDKTPKFIIIVYVRYKNLIGGYDLNVTGEGGKLKSVQ